jgi:hypothetical protein
MTDLELIRSPHDRRLYELGHAGTVRLIGWAARVACAETADGRRYDIARRGMFRPGVDATDATGTAVGRFSARGMRRGGTLRWMDRVMELRPASRWRERYALAESDRELAVFEGKGWGKRPVTVTLDDDAALDPGLLLFTAFVVRGLAEDAGAVAAGTSAATGAAAAAGS